MARKSDEELKVVKNKYGVNELYSWSRLNTYKNCHYEYYLKYIKKVNEDRNDSIYAISGGACHDILEKLYSKNIDYCNMLDEYEDNLLNFNFAELKYDRCNEDKNKIISNKYEYCIRHFFKNHKPINGKVDIERFITVLIGKYVFQGYIDAIHKENGFYTITDWKTSSIYTGKKILKECGQLILYSEALYQLGVPIENIKCRWNFLKYVNIEVPQANEKTVIRNIERNEIGNKLASNIKMWMKKEGFLENEIDEHISLACELNDISHLPAIIKSKYNISDCYVEVPLSKEIIDNLKQDIIQTIDEMKEKKELYLKTNDEMIWWDDVTPEKSYYFANLCGYSANLHKPYGVYLDSLNTSNNRNNDDLSWLNDL